MQNVSICNALQSSGGNAYHHLGQSTYFGSGETRLHKSIRGKVVSLAIYLTGVYLSYSALDRTGTVVAYAAEEEKWMTTNTSFG